MLAAAWRGMLRHGATDPPNGPIRRCGVLTLGLALALPPAFAVEEMREFNDGGKKAGKAKSCPKGARYSEKKRGCVKTSCGRRASVEQRH